MQPARDAEDLLRQRTRARLVDALLELKRPATTEELADRVDLHRTGVRVHLEQLEAAGVIERHRVRQARGRPRDAWSVKPEELPEERRPDAYAELATWLAGAIPASPERLGEIEAAGREAGRALAARSSALAAEDRLEAAFQALGFQPRRTEQDEQTCCLELGRCPYRDAVRVNQLVVCALHRGLTEGLLDGSDPGLRLTGFVPNDPDEAGCLVTVARG